MKAFLLLTVFLSLPAPGICQNRGELDTIYRKGSLSGSIGSRIRQNDQANKENLSRIKDDTELERFIKKSLLVPIYENENIGIDPRLEIKLRFVRPYTKIFLNDMGTAFQRIFGKPIQVNSAVRTVVYQKDLIKKNANADSADGQITSSHLTGSTVDIAKNGISRIGLWWIRVYLINLEREDKIEATEENAQAVFHVMVYKNYISGKKND
ncbi:MAG: DUF5715 family protein [Patescibacteria group bacterium]